MTMTRITTLVALLLSAVATPTDALMTVRLEIDFDDKPEDTAWELRGPGIKLVAKADYDDYDPIEYANTKYTQTFELVEGQSYYFLMTDYYDDDIESASFKLFAQVPSGDVLLEEGKQIRSGKAVNFVAPTAPTSVIGATKVQ